MLTNDFIKSSDVTFIKEQITKSITISTRTENIWINDFVSIQDEVDRDAIRDFKGIDINELLEPCHEDTEIEQIQIDEQKEWYKKEFSDENGYKKIKIENNKEIIYKVTENDT